MTIKEIIEQSGGQPDRDKMIALLWRWAGSTGYCEAKMEELNKYMRMFTEGVVFRSKDGDAAAVRSGRVGDPTYAAAKELMKMEAAFSARAASIAEDCEIETDLAMQVDDIIRKLSPVQRELIELRYKRRLPTWASIAKHMSYNKEYVRKMHAQTLDQLLESVKFLAN